MNATEERELHKAILGELILIANGGDIQMFGEPVTFSEQFRAEIRNDLLEMKAELARDLILYG